MCVQLTGLVIYNLWATIVYLIHEDDCVIACTVPGSANRMCLEEWQHIHSKAPSSLLKMLASLCTSSLQQLHKVQICTFCNCTWL